MFKILFAAAALVAPATFMAVQPAHHSLYAAEPPVAAAPPSIAVLHGDAIVVDGRHVRLVDAVTPQPAPYAHCVAEAMAARQARLRLGALANDVHKVSITPAGGVDAYNRIKAHVTFDGTDPAGVLISEGLAVAPGAGAVDWCGAVSQKADGVRHIAMLSSLGG
jgi:endonuclease YncB( thermonuclease family)